VVERVRCASQSTNHTGGVVGSSKIFDRLLIVLGSLGVFTLHVESVGDANYVVRVIFKLCTAQQSFGRCRVVPLRVMDRANVVQGVRDFLVIVQRLEFLQDLLINFQSLVVSLQLFVDQGQARKSFGGFQLVSRVGEEFSCFAIAFQGQAKIALEIESRSQVE